VNTAKKNENSNLGESNKRSKYEIITQETDLKYMSPFPVVVSLHTIYA
jgi:hypothetical protein